MNPINTNNSLISRRRWIIPLSVAGLVILVGLISSSLTYAIVNNSNKSSSTSVISVTSTISMPTTTTSNPSTTETITIQPTTTIISTTLQLPVLNQLKLAKDLGNWDKGLMTTDKIICSSHSNDTAGDNSMSDISKYDTFKLYANYGSSPFVTNYNPPSTYPDLKKYADELKSNGWVLCASDTRVATGNGFHVEVYKNKNMYVQTTQIYGSRSVYDQSADDGYKSTMNSFTGGEQRFILMSIPKGYPLLNE